MKPHTTKPISVPAEMPSADPMLGVAAVQQQPLADLIAAAVDGRPVAQEQILARLSPRVLRLARMLSGAAVDPEDAAQRALIEIFQSLGSFRNESSLEAWADRITVRVVQREARLVQRRLRLLDRWFAPGAMPFGRSVPHTSEGAEGLVEMLQRLTPERREAVVLRHVLEYSVEEVAQLTGAPVGTVRDRLVTARRQLRNWLGRAPSKAERRAAVRKRENADAQ